MLIVEPGLDDRELVRGLLDAAEGYLRGRGAKVVYGGSLFPLNPFYWGLYGGSEGSGVLSGHVAFHRGLIDGGYRRPARRCSSRSTSARPEPRDPRTPLIRRQTQVEFDEDAPPPNWWQGLALGDFTVTDARLLAKSDGAELARASTWDMAGSTATTAALASASSTWKLRRAPTQGLRPLPRRRDPPPRPIGPDRAGRGPDGRGEPARPGPLRLARLRGRRSSDPLSVAPLARRLIR